MHNKFLISDTHFGHKNILDFKDNQGNLTRVFSSVEEMDEVMVQNWNRVVRPVDRVYHMGDVVMNRRCLPILNRLNGKKVLLKGNHDMFPLKDYVPYFEDIRSYRVFPELRLIVSHIPIHTYDLEGRFKYNAHGHLHKNIIADPRYINLCVEQINYTPILLEEVIAKLERQNETKL